MKLLSERGREADQQSEKRGPDYIPPQFRFLPAETIQFLMQLGFKACGRGFYRESMKLFRGIAAVRPYSDLPHLAMAIASMNIGLFKQAIAILLNKALVLNPENQLSQAFLGMALCYKGEEDVGREILRNVVREGTDQEATNLAKNLLTEDFKAVKRKILQRG